ncbi:MAG: EamA family transporter [Oscillospiraceae bacterium]|nr:EamA family transporter [Oscillospiraceae bacterium]
MKKISASNGSFYILLAALLFSSGGLLIKLIPWNPVAINGARNIFAVVVTYFYIKKLGHKIVVNVPVILCACAVAATCIMYSIAAKLTTAANAIVLQYTSPIFIILFMWIFFKQKPHRLDLITCFVVSCGIVCFFLESLSPSGTVGNLLALLSGVTYACVFMANMFKGSDSLSIYLFSQIIGAVVGLPFLMIQTNITAASLGAVAFMGLIQVGLAYMFMSKGLATTPPVTASILCMLEPILNPMWVAVFYGEKMTALPLLGCFIVLISVAVYNVLTQLRVKKSNVP